MLGALGGGGLSQSQSTSLQNEQRANIGVNFGSKVVGQGATGGPSTMMIAVVAVAVVAVVFFFLKRRG